MRISQIIKRDFGSQFSVSRNMEESLPMFLARMFWSAFYFLKAIMRGISAMRSEQLGSRVIYDGRDWFVSNLAGSASPTLSYGAGTQIRYVQHVPREKIRNVMSIGELWHRFCFGFSFYTCNWMEIEIQNRLYP